MSASSLARIMAGTESRLRSATPDQFRSIYSDHVAALARDLAETLFLQVKADPRFGNAQINALILSTLKGLVEGISDVLDRNSVIDPVFEEESRGVAGDAFLERLEQLFVLSETQGASAC